SDLPGAAADRPADPRSRLSGTGQSAHFVSLYLGCPGVEPQLWGLHDRDLPGRHPGHSFRTNGGRAGFGHALLADYVVYCLAASLAHRDSADWQSIYFDAKRFGARLVD